MALVGFSLLNVVSGLLLQLVFASFFGVSSEMDALWLSFALVTALHHVVAAVVRPTLVPLLSVLASDQGRAQSLLRQFAIVVGAGTLGIVLIIMALSRLAVELIAPGFGPAEADLAGLLLLVEAPSVLFLTLADIGASSYLVRKQFARPAAAPFVGSLTSLLVSLAAIPILGVAGAALGFTVGYATQCVVVFGPFKAVRWRPLQPLVSLDLRRALNTMMPLLLGAVLSKAYVVVERSVASALPAGSVSYLGYANKMVVMISWVFIQTLATYLLPQFASTVRRGASESGEAVFIAYQMAMIASGPLVLGTIANSSFLLRVLLEHGAFDAEATLEVTRTLWCYCVGAFLMGNGVVLSNAIYAIHAPKIVALAGFGALVVGGPVAFFASAPLAHYGIALAFAAYAIVFNLVQIVYLQKEVMLPTMKVLVFTAENLLLGLALWVVFVLLTKNLGDGLLASSIHIGCAVVMVIIHYGVLLFAYRKRRAAEKLLMSFRSLVGPIQKRFAGV